MLENGKVARIKRRSRMSKPMSIQAASCKQQTAIFAFDLLVLDGEDPQPLPLLERTAPLKDVLTDGNASAT